MAATLRARAGGWRLLVMDEATRGPQGRRRVVLFLYLLLSPIGIAASLALGARGGYGPVIAKALPEMSPVGKLRLVLTSVALAWKPKPLLPNTYCNAPSSPRTSASGPFT